jgi:galactitol-specific phosphotransferase system IIB component
MVNDTTGVINAANLTITAVTNTKTYDGTTVAAAVPTYTGLQTGDTLAGLTEAYADKHAGTGKTLNVSGYTLTDGNDGHNYHVTMVNDTTGVINAANLTITAVTNTKEYDGTTVAAAVPTYTGLQTGDTLAGLTEAYADKHAGTGKTLNVSGYTLTDGNDGHNYHVTMVNDTTGVINAANLTITAATNTKEYDGNTSAAAVPIVNGLQATDMATELSETYDTKDAGTGKTLMPSAVISDGNGGNNYLITYVNNTTGVINPGQIVSGMLDVAAAGKTIDFAVNGTLLPDRASTDASGNYSLMVPLNTIPDNSALLAYVANDSSLKSASIYLATGGNIDDLLLSSNTVTASSGGALSNATFGIAKGALSSGDIPYSVSGNDLTLSSGFNLTMKAGSDITLNGLINAGAGHVTLNSGGAIINGMAGSVSISAASLVAHAVNGIGSGDPLMTSVSDLYAVNTLSNSIEIDNVGALVTEGGGLYLYNGGAGDIIFQNIGAIVTGASTISSGGDLSITAHSPLTIGAGGVYAYGNVTLAAAPTVAGGSDDLTINGMVSSARGNIALSAGSNVVMGSGAQLSASSGTIVVTDQLNNPTPATPSAPADSTVNTTRDSVVALSIVTDKTNEKSETLAMVETKSEKPADDGKDDEEKKKKEKDKEGGEQKSDDAKKDDKAKKYCN